MMFAMCMYSKIDVWPRTNEISLNSLLIVEGYGGSQTIVRELNKKYNIYLKSETSRIPLEVIKRYEGQFKLTQIVLRPTRDLIAGTTYTLHIDSLDKFEKDDFYGSNFKWTVSDKFDHEAPEWRRKPNNFGKEKAHYGCGPASFVNFCVCYQDNSPVKIYSKLTNLRTGKTFEYLVSPVSNTLRIGYGMCSGEFYFEDGEKYEVSFSLMDASGNKTDSLTKGIQFISPTDNDTITEEENTLCNCPERIEKRKSNFGMVMGAVLTILTFSGLIIYRRIKKGSH